jgi:mevalonate pyrophosphate decarboxylase
LNVALALVGASENVKKFDHLDRRARLDSERAARAWHDPCQVTSETEKKRPTGQKKQKAVATP